MSGERVGDLKRLKEIKKLKTGLEAQAWLDKQRSTPPQPDRPFHGLQSKGSPTPSKPEQS
jgi:hypothetical protein